MDRHRQLHHHPVKLAVGGDFFRYHVVGAVDSGVVADVVGEESSFLYFSESFSRWVYHQVFLSEQGIDHDFGLVHVSFRGMIHELSSISFRRYCRLAQRACPLRASKADSFEAGSSPSRLHLYSLPKSCRRLRHVRVCADRCDSSLTEISSLEMI